MIDSLRQSADAAEFVDRWGVAEKSERRPGGLRVRLDDGPFAELDVRPWSATSSGVVDVELGEDTPALSWKDVQTAFGPFEDQDDFDLRERWFGAMLKGSGLPGVLVRVRVRDDVVDAITLRRDPS